MLLALSKNEILLWNRSYCCHKSGLHSLSNFPDLLRQQKWERREYLWKIYLRTVFRSCTDFFFSSRSIISVCRQRHKNTISSHKSLIFSRCKTIHENHFQIFRRSWQHSSAFPSTSSALSCYRITSWSCVWFWLVSIQLSYPHWSSTQINSSIHHVTQLTFASPALFRHPPLISYHWFCRQHAPLVQLNTKWLAVLCLGTVPENSTWVCKIVRPISSFDWHNCALRVASHLLVALPG